MTAPRTGPRPLPLLMATQLLTSLSSIAALPLLRNGSLNLNRNLQDAVSSLARDIEKTNPEDFADAVKAEAVKRIDSFADGIALYQRAPAAARPAEPPIIWQRRSARLLDYGAVLEGAANAPAVLCIPSLINRGHILDLSEDRSLIRAISRRGLRPLLLDWGTPDEVERTFTLSDYIDLHLGAALDRVRAETGNAPAILGYCMGGNLALGLAARRPGEVGPLALLATPWDFHAGHDLARVALNAMQPSLEIMITAQGTLPVDALQALFNGLNPGLASSKFRDLGNVRANSKKFANFVALEDWLNDGVPLAGPVARECLFDWYVKNTPGRGHWTINGTTVDPTKLDQPALVIVPKNDYIVPPGSARPLADALPNSTLRTIKTGHIGMVAGGRSDTLLHRPLADWFAGQLS